MSVLVSPIALSIAIPLYIFLLLLSFFPLYSLLSFLLCLFSFLSVFIFTYIAFHLCFSVLFSSWPLFIILCLIVFLSFL